jgi:hypothetical protein
VSCRGDTLKAAAERFGAGPAPFRTRLLFAVQQLMAEDPGQAGATARVDGMYEILDARAREGLPISWRELMAFEEAYSHRETDALRYGLLFGLMYGRSRRLPPPERVRRALAFARRAAERAG